MGCLKVLVRSLVSLLAAAVWLFGVILVLVCLWTFATSSPSKYEPFIEGRLPVTYFLLGVGLLFLVDGTLGWAGASKRNRILLKLFLILTFFIFVAEVGLILTLSIFKTNSTLVGDQLWLEMNQRTQFLIQEHLQCCGLNGPSDYESSRDFDSSCYHRELPAAFADSPLSPASIFPFAASKPTSDELAHSKNVMNVDGCRQKLLDFSHDNRLYILAASASLLIYQLLTMLLTASAISLTRRRGPPNDSLEELDRSSGNSALHSQQVHAHSLGYQAHGPTYM